MAQKKCYFVDAGASSQILNVGKDFGKIRTPSRMFIAGPTMIGWFELYLLW